MKPPKKPARVAQLIVSNTTLSKSPTTPYGGGGGGDDMIERIVKLEAGMEHVQRDVTELRDDMRDVRDRLKGLEIKVDHLPSKGFIVAVVLTTLAALTALLGYQDQLQAFFNGSSPQ